jgi:cell division protein FtsB
MENKIRKKVRAGLKKKRRLIAGVLLFMNGYLLLSFFFSGMGFFKAIKMQKNHAAVQEDIRSLQRENKQLSKRIAGLKNDPFYIERLARDRLGLVKEGELVYEFFPESK